MERHQQTLTLLEVLIVVGLIALILVIALPNLFQSKAAGNEVSAIASLRTLMSAQIIFQQRFPQGTPPGEYAPDLQALALNNLLDEVLGSGTKQGYLFSTGVDPAAPGYRYWVMATPQVAGTSGGRSFASNHQGSIFFSSDPLMPPGTPADCSACHQPTLPDLVPELQALGAGSKDSASAKGSPPKGP